MKTKPKCIIEGCNNVRTSRGNGKLRLLCHSHHRKRYGMSIRGTHYGGRKGMEKVKYEGKTWEISKQSCSKCGWSESYVDRHRIDKKKGYVDGNVVPLCPNCHRVETMKEMGFLA